jgi:hypothetical protein
MVNFIEEIFSQEEPGLDSEGGGILDDLQESFQSRCFLYLAKEQIGLMDAERLETELRQNLALLRGSQQQHPLKFLQSSAKTELIFWNKMAMENPQSPHLPYGNIY